MLKNDGWSDQIPSLFPKQALLEGVLAICWGLGKGSRPQKFGWQRGFPWSTMVSHGLPWAPVVFRELYFGVL